MNGLEKFHENLNASDLDVTNEDTIKKELLEISGELKKEGSNDIFKLSELLRQCYAVIVSFDLDDVTGKPGGVRQMSCAKHEDGKEISLAWPDIDQFSDSDFEYIEERYINTKNLFTKTHFGSILYFQKPTSYSRHNDFKENLSKEFLKLAKSYKQKALNIETKNRYSCHVHYAIKASLQIAIASKFKELKKDISKFVVDLHQQWDLERSDSLRMGLDITRLVTANYKHVKDYIDPRAILKQNLANAEIQSKKYTWGAIYIVDATIDLAQKAGMNYLTYKKKKAELYEQLADEAEGTPRQLAAISFVEKALRLYRELKDQENVGRIEKRYQKIRGSGNFGTVQQELDQEYVNRIMAYINKEIDKATTTEILQALSVSPMFSSHEVILESSEEAFVQNISMNLFSSSVADKFGNTVAKYSTEEERKLFSFWRTYAFFFQIEGKWLSYFFMSAYKKGKLDYDSTIDLLTHSWLNEPIPRSYNGEFLKIRPLEILIPPIRLLFAELQALSANDDYDFNAVVLCDSLTLKIEALLRYMCERIGIATFKQRENGIVMEKNIDDLLADIRESPETPTGFSENDRLFIKFVLSEKVGLNLRNRIAHGLMDSNEYGFDNLIVVFTIIPRFSKYSFSKEV